MWKVHLRAAGGGGESEKWFQIQDLIVEEIRKEMIFLGESILQVSWTNRYRVYADSGFRYGSGGRAYAGATEVWTSIGTKKTNTNL